jgi:hypothetical protein
MNEKRATISTTPTTHCAVSTASVSTNRVTADHAEPLNEEQ